MTPALDANELVDQVADIVRPDAEARKVALSVQPASSPAQVWGDRVQLQQVLVNLLLNAMDAVNDRAPEKRIVSVRVQTLTSGAEFRVSDTGPGITAENLNRLFDPFFTTKPSGLGMGLAISQTIIAAHGGRITAENNANGGATFRFTLSAAAKPGTKL